MDNFFVGILFYGILYPGILYFNMLRRWLIFGIIDIPCYIDIICVLQFRNTGYYNNLKKCMLGGANFFRFFFIN